MTASGWREKLTAEVSSPGPMVCAMWFFGLRAGPGSMSLLSLHYRNQL